MYVYGMCEEIGCFVGNFNVSFLLIYCRWYFGEILKEECWFVLEMDGWIGCFLVCDLLEGGYCCSFL